MNLIKILSNDIAIELNILDINAISITTEESLAEINLKIRRSIEDMCNLNIISDISKNKNFHACNLYNLYSDMGFNQIEHQNLDIVYDFDGISKYFKTYNN